MKFKLFDLYSDYLLSSFSATTATGMSALMDEASPGGSWRRCRRSMQGEEGVITIDDSIVEKPNSRLLPTVQTRPAASATAATLRAAAMPPLPT